MLLQVLKATAFPGLNEKLAGSNELLEKILKGLNAYLEKKRLFFPRYTLSPSHHLTRPPIR